MFKKFFTLFLIVLWYEAAYAYHPLITDDTGTQGKGKIQLEVQAEFFSDKEPTTDSEIKQTGGEVATVLSYGLTENLDIIVGLPYQWFKIKEDSNITENQKGISDMTLEMKWRFYEHKGLSLGLKPGITFPTGDDDKGLGAGRATYSFFFITTKETEPWDFHLNLGYIRNENKAGERKNIWHASTAAAVEVVKDLKIAANIGIETNTDKESNTHPAFVIGGIVYSPNEDVDLSFGIKGSLNKPEMDKTLLTGITWRF